MIGARWPSRSPSIASPTGHGARNVLATRRERYAPRQRRSGSGLPAAVVDQFSETSSLIKLTGALQRPLSPDRSWYRLYRPWAATAGGEQLATVEQILRTAAGDSILSLPSISLARPVPLHGPSPAMRKVSRFAYQAARAESSIARRRITGQARAYQGGQARSGCSSFNLIHTPAGFFARPGAITALKLAIQAQIAVAAPAKSTPV
jgi:hypothetical protein